MRIRRRIPAVPKVTGIRADPCDAGGPAWAAVPQSDGSVPTVKASDRILRSASVVR